MSLFDKFFRSPARGNQTHRGFDWPDPTSFAIENRWAWANQQNEENQPMLNPTLYQPAIVIGLGKCGENVVNRWLDLVAMNPAGPQNYLTTFIIKEEPLQSVPNSSRNCKVFSLSEGKGSNKIMGLVAAREPVKRAFRSQMVIQPFSNNLSAEFIRINQIGITPHIIIVASVSENMSGLIGEVGQLVRTVIPQPRPVVSLFITLRASPDSIQLPSGEIYATLREIQRMSAPQGRNVIETGAFTEKQTVTAEIFDQVYLLDVPQITLESTRDPFEFSSGPALSEAIYWFLHPCFHNTNLWPYRAGSWGSISVSTLELPYTEILKYFSVRMATAAIFGEHINRPNEGIISSQNTEVSIPTGESILTHWFRVSDHPFLNWLIEPVNFATLHGLPKITEQYERFYLSVIAKGVLEVLNSADTAARFQQAQLGLTAAASRINNIRKNVAKISLDDDLKLPFQGMMTRMEDKTNRLLEQVKTWQSAFGGREEPHETTSLYEILQQRLTSTEDALNNFGGGIVCQPVVGLIEAKEFYEESIREELCRTTSRTSEVYSTVQKRLGWWIDISRIDYPHLYFVVLDQSIEELLPSRPPEAACLTHDQMEQIAKVLEQMSSDNMRGIPSRLSSFAGSKLIINQTNKLALAGADFVAYNHDIAFQQNHAGIEREKAFIIWNQIAPDLKRIAFPQIPSVQNISNGDSHRLTALRVINSIPFDAFDFMRSEKIKYARQSWFHIYPQEHTTAACEQKIARMFSSLSGNSVQFTPELVMTLYSPRLVSIFFHSLKYGLIHVDYSQSESGIIHRWVLAPGTPWETIQLMNIEDRPEHHLWNAYWTFTLILPFEVNIQSVQHPFHRLNQERYLKFIQSRVTEIERDSTVRARQVQINEQILLRFSELAKTSNNAKLNGFYDLYQLDSQDTIWKDWSKW